MSTRLAQSKEFNTQSTSLRGQLVDLAKTYEIPMGLELLAGKLTFSGDNLTVRQILNRLVAMQDGALWVVHLNPARTMRGEPFYSQAYATTGTSSPDFYWEFLPLR